MPSTIYNFSGSDITLRYKQPFTSEGLNSKFLAVLASGVYRGFRLAADTGANRSVDIIGDAVALDNIAVVNTAAGYSLTIRKAAGFTLSLSAFAGSTVVICIAANYAVLATTTANISIYTTTDYDNLTAANKLALVALGTVIVPASDILIPAANVTYDRRNSAWERTALEAITPVSVLKNSSFELSSAAALGKFAIPFWENEITTGTATWKVIAGTPNLGAKSVEFEATSLTISGTLAQRLNIPVNEDQLVKTQFYFNNAVACTSGASSGTVFIEWGSNTGAVLSESTSTIGLDAVTVGYAEINRTFITPANATHIKRVGLKLDSATYAATGIKFHIDDFNSFIEVLDPKTLNINATSQSPVSAYPLILDDPSAIFANVPAMLRYDSAENEVIGDRLDQTSLPPILNWLGQLKLGDNLLGTEANSLLSRVTAAVSVVAGSEYTLMWESVPSAEKGMRWYVSRTGGLHITQNAVWNGTTNRWSKDVSSQPASKIEFLSSTFRILSKDAAGTTEPWTDVIDLTLGWTISAIEIGLQNPTTANLNGFLNLGASVLGTLDNAIFPKIITYLADSGLTPRTLLWSFGFGPGDGEATSKIYGDASSNRALEIVSNATWDGSQWLGDDPVKSATRVVFDIDGITYFYKDDTSAVWNDSGWLHQVLTIDAAGQEHIIGGSLELGTNILDTTANALLPRLITPLINGGATRTLLLTTEDDAISGTGVIHTSIYAQSGNIEIAVNCKFDGTNWSRTNVASGTASKTIYKSSGLTEFYKKSDISVAWSDSSWDTSAVPSVIVSAETNPDSTTGFKNTLTNANICKAWVKATTNELGDSAITIHDGFNIASVTQNVDGNANLAYIQVDWEQAFADANYSVTVTSGPPVDSLAFTLLQVIEQTAARIRIKGVRFYDPLATSTVGAAGIGLPELITFYVQAVGKQ